VKAIVEVIGDHGCEYMIFVIKQTSSLGIKVSMKGNKQFRHYSKHKKKHGYLFTLKYVH
jgi:hypothetical protein